MVDILAKACLATLCLFSLVGCSSDNSRPNEEKSAVKHKQKAKNSAKEKTKKEVESEASTSASFDNAALLQIANSMFDDYFGTYFGFVGGTYFDTEFSGTTEEYRQITDARIQSLNDIENIWYEKFSRRYPAPYNDTSLNPYGKQAFIERDGRVYELYQIDGFVGNDFYFDHVVSRTNDEFWVACFSEGVDGSIQDTGQTWSFVFENGTWKFGAINR